MARRAIRHVHPLGSLRGACRRIQRQALERDRRMDHVVGEYPARPVRADSRRISIPVKFDAATWVRTAKDAGMKYIVITSKHHDGFSMFDSDVSAYDIVDSTPFKTGSDAGARRRSQAAGDHVRVLLLHHGLAPSRRSTWTRRARIQPPATARQDARRAKAGIRRPT